MFIIALILILSIHSSYSDCNEFEKIIKIPSKYHKGVTRHPIHFERIQVKKGNTEIGNILPDNDIWEIYPYRMFGFIYPDHNKAKVYFKPSIDNNNHGYYEFFLIVTWNQIEQIGTALFEASSTTTTPPARRVDNKFVITESIHHFACGDDNVPTLWNVIWKGTLQAISTKSNTIRKSQITDFTKMYCESSIMCHTSKILRIDGLEEELTWESDFRHTKTGYKEALQVKHYNKSATDWYIPLSIPERVHVYIDDSEILDTTERKITSNIDNRGVTLVWIDDKIRLEFNDALAAEFKVSFDWDPPKFAKYSIMWVSYTPPKPKNNTKIIYIYKNTGTTIQISLILLIITLIAPPPPHLNKIYGKNTRFKLIFFSYINPN